jgi:hypothetical protein
MLPPTLRSMLYLLADSSLQSPPQRFVMSGLLCLPLHLILSTLQVELPTASALSYMVN